MCVQYLDSLPVDQCGDRLGKARHQRLEGDQPAEGQTAARTESLEPLGFEFLIELLDKAFEGGSFELQAELLDWLGKDLLDLRGRFFEIGHRWRG